MFARLASKALKSQLRTFVAHYPPISGSKAINTPMEAIAGIKDGQTILIGGYGKFGAPYTLIDALAKSKIKDLTVVCSIATNPEMGSSIQSLLEQNQISRLITSNVEGNPLIYDQFKQGKLQVTLVPLGNLAEKVRGGGLGIPAFYTNVGAGTFYEFGGLPEKYSPDGKIITIANEAKECRMFRGLDCLLERQIQGDFSLVKGKIGDTKGNIISHMAHRNYNPDFASAGRICISEADEVVQAGNLDGDDIHISGIFVHRVTKSLPSVYESFKPQTCSLACGYDPIGKENRVIREKMAKRAAQEINSHQYVVLDSGLPKAVEQFVPKEVDCDYVALETGVFGAVTLPDEAERIIGITDGNFRKIGLRKNAAIAKSSDTFAGLRGNHLHVAVMEGYQVSQYGDLASLSKGDCELVSPKIEMDLTASKIKKVVLMEMNTNGKDNLVPKCSYQLSGRNCVNTLITDIGVFEFRNNELVLTELFPGMTIDDVRSKTKCSFKTSTDLKISKV